MTAQQPARAGKVLTLGDRVQTDKTALIAAMGADSFSATLLMMGK
jgi:hypothetical protein